MRSKPLFFLSAILILPCLIAVSTLSVTAAGVVDRAFGRDGRVVPALGSGAVLHDIATFGSEIVIAGSFASGGSEGSVFIYRLNADGDPNEGFGNAGFVRLAISGASLSIAKVETLASGAVVAAGSIAYTDGSSDLMVLRLLPDGSFDPAFGEGGLATIDIGKADEAGSLILLRDGSIVVAGMSGGQEPAAIAVKLFSDGRRDPAFGSEGIATYHFQNASFFRIETPTDVEELADGSFRIGGDWEFTLEGIERIGSYFVDIDRSGVPQGFDATPYITRSSYSCRASFDGVTLDDGRYLHVGRQGGVNQFHDGSKLIKLPGGKIAAAGGCLGGGLKIYSADDLRLIGADLDLEVKTAAALSDGRIAVLTAAGEITVLKGVTSAGTRHQNFSGGNRADLSVFRKSDRTLYVNDLAGAVLTLEFPAAVTRIIPERAVFRTSIEGVKRDTIGYWNIPGKPGVFGIRDSDGGTYLSHAAGARGDIPIAGDFDGDGALDTGFFRSAEGNWYRKIHFASELFGEAFKWGVPGDKPVPADYDGDGRTDIAVYRPSNGTWWIRRSSDEGVTAVQFGIATDVPLTGDFDADGRADLTVYRPGEGNWYQYLTTEGFRVVKFGTASDIPVPADYDGDGRFDIAVYREGIWFLLQSREGFAAVQWGSPGDVPVTARYDS